MPSVWGARNSTYGSPRRAVLQAAARRPCALGHAWAKEWGSVCVQWMLPACAQGVRQRGLAWQVSVEPWLMRILACCACVWSGGVFLLEKG